MTRLILIRHGQTDYNLQKRYCGFSDPPLNNTGMQQSKGLIDKVRSFEINKIYSSDLRRAYETAEIIFRYKSIEKTKTLREINFGIFEGLKYREIMKKHSGIYTQWINNPENIKIPDGEGIKDLEKRVQEKLSIIISCNSGKTIAVVTHEGPIKIILCHVMKCGLRKFWNIKQNHCSLNIIDCPEVNTINYERKTVLCKN